MANVTDVYVLSLSLSLSLLLLKIKSLSKPRTDASVILYSNDLKTPFPLVDADPHFNRVIKYMRGSDYALWAAGAGAAPAAIYAMGKSTLSLYPSLLS